MRKAALVLIASISLIFPNLALAQVGSASINGIITDTSGAVIPEALVTITNLATTGKREVHSNGTGNYVFLDLQPGRYKLEVSKEGFAVSTLPEFTLEVNQASTYDFTLRPRTATQSVTVAAQATMVQAATATLGSVVSPTEVEDLPLNGRNFTQILNLTPGVSPISVGQNSGTTVQFNHAVGTFSYPSVNGQSNRSNFFYMNGANDQGSFGSSYDFPPIVDQIQEFKVESHPDSAETGGVLGGVIDVVTKSGTNHFHGDVWEFVRNNAFDARNPFLTTVVPYKQNQFGGTIGGPVILPGYHGRDKTWFFGAYEGFRNHTTASSEFTTVTPAELTGNFSLVEAQIYNPFSTAPDPANPGKFLRQPFLCTAAGTPEPAVHGIQAAGGTACNIIPSNMIDAGMASYISAIVPVTTGLPNSNGVLVNTTPNDTRQDLGSMRFDHNFNDKNSVFVMYSGFTEPVSATAGVPNVYQYTWAHGYQGVATYTHTFGGSGVADFTVARVRGQGNIQVLYPSSAGTAWETAGFAQAFASNFIGNASYNPGINISGYFSVGTGNIHQTIPFTDTDEVKGDAAITHGRHTLKFGANIQTNNNPPCSIRTALSETFSSINTDNPETSAGGNALASYLLSVPNSAARRNVCESQTGGWVDGFFVQDQWKPTSKLTVNIGFRYDFTIIPHYGNVSTGSIYTGDLDLQNGTYILQDTPPACSATVGAPCIPGGTLPANVVVTPHSNHGIYNNTFDNWQPRLGVAYRLRPNTVVRASFGRFFDNWAAVLQMAQNFEGSWPGIGQLNVNNLNLPEPSTPTPTATAEDPEHLGTSVPLPAANPFGQVNYFANPAIQNPYSDMWNIGVEQQFGVNTVVAVNYVGSETIRADVGLYGNTALTPGAGTPQLRAPYTYITPSYYDNSIGRASFNALEVSLNRRTARGLTYRLSYTWSKTMDFGADGWFDSEGTVIQQPYDLQSAHSVAGYDLTNMFSTNWVYELPFGPGKQFNSSNRVVSQLIGGWKLNGIVTLQSGQPYSVEAPSGIANTGNTVELANIVGNPSLSNRSAAEWFNTAAFASPAEYTFGDVGRNTLRSNWYKNVDLALFRDFHIKERMMFELRGEFFNAFNNVVWAVPDNNTGDTTFGRALSIINTPRQVEIAAKFYF